MLLMRKSDVGHLRVFGCTAYAHIQKDERKKLDIKAKKCALVGYGTEVKGYRVFDPLTRKVMSDSMRNKLELRKEVFSTELDNEKV